MRCGDNNLPRIVGLEHSCTESAQITRGSPGMSRMTNRAPSLMAGGTAVGTVAERMRSAQSRTPWPGAQPSAAAARLTWLITPCSSM